VSGVLLAKIPVPATRVKKHKNFSLLS
jgi:hypothetical protein